jgi:hypothetical protein
MWKYCAELTMLGHPKALQFLIATFPDQIRPKLPTSSQVLCYADKENSFPECVSALLSAGWKPHETFLADCLTKRVGRIDNLGRCYSIFCGLVTTFSANAIPIQADLLHVVIPSIISCGVGSSDPPADEIVEMLITAGAEVDGRAIKLATDGSLWGCVAKMALALKQ